MSSRCFFCTISSNGKSTPSALTVTRSRSVKSPWISSVERIAPGQSGIERGAKGSRLQDAVKPNKIDAAITNEVDFVNPDEWDSVIPNQLNAVILDEPAAVILEELSSVTLNESDAVIRCGTAIRPKPRRRPCPYSVSLRVAKRTRLSDQTPASECSMDRPSPIAARVTGASR